MTDANITLTANPPSTSLSTETLFHILANSRRRAVIQQLHRSDDSQLSASDLAESIVQQEDKETSKRSCYVSLIQNHLQKLDEDGIVEYDPDTKTAEASSYDIAALAWFVEHGEAITNAA